LGPNGGEGACNYNTNRNRCVADANFVDNVTAPEPDPEPEPKPELEPVVKANCSSTNTARACRKTLGPNGGEGACKYNTNQNRCVANADFVDNVAGPESEPEPEPELVEKTDCASIKTAKPCRKMFGPNGGEGACKYNTNTKRCVTNANFVDVASP
jgi:hypothetical protein